MTAGLTFRIYLIEPMLAALLESFLVNVYGLRGNASFMHSSARDCLSLLLVLLAAAIALWAGLFFLSPTDFGKWLAQKGAAEQVNRAFTVNIGIFLGSSVATILATYFSESHTTLQITCLFLSIWSLLSVTPMLNNTRRLLHLYAQFLNKPIPVQSIKNISNS